MHKDGQTDTQTQHKNKDNCVRTVMTSVRLEKPDVTRSRFIEMTLPWTLHFQDTINMFAKKPTKQKLKPPLLSASSSKIQVHPQITDHKYSNILAMCHLQVMKTLQCMYQLNHKLQSTKAALGCVNDYILEGSSQCLLWWSTGTATCVQTMRKCLALNNKRGTHTQHQQSMLSMGELAHLFISSVASLSDWPLTPVQFITFYTAPPFTTSLASNTLKVHESIQHRRYDFACII